MAYTHMTLAQARASLARQLRDTSYKYWSTTELDRHIQEALRIRQALTASHRTRVTFQTVANTAFYDLCSKASAQFSYSILDTDIFHEIQAHLLETEGLPWSGTEQFTEPFITAAIEGRRNQFLLETGTHLTRSTGLTVAGPPIGRVPLEDSIIDLRRVVWVDGESHRTTLHRDDEFALDSFSPGWQLSPDAPKCYSVAVSPLVSLQISPPPLASGELELISLSTGSALNPTTGVALGVPDDFSWAVKWGALADILWAEGQGQDLARASACERLWQIGVEVCKAYPSVLTAAINEKAVTPCAVADLDSWEPGWENDSDEPENVAMAGRNLLALSPVPEGIYGVSLDVVAKAAVPATAGAYLEIGREDVDVVLGMAQYLASFKMGHAEWAAVSELAQAMFRSCSLKNRRLAASATFRDALEQPAALEEKAVQRVKESEVEV